MNATSRDKRKVRTSVGIDPDDYRELEAMARKHRVSMSWMIREAVKQYLKNKRPLLSRDES
ncbi:ribbon-helix-helix domain-containing protein [Planctomycetes bacterium K23_9]|uniref:Ribbon-helix-helix protein, copG family n=1 Tax=Stieleria marina TaxID=1930275 RepID=A0A517NVZ3_9BACT|nr:Ribbon-helix-helix protein, copG family [Planctomycetes bacterium K23_9]